MGLSFETPINFDVLLINTFITQLPVVFGELGRISLAGVFERRLMISIGTFVVFIGMIRGTDRCFVNNTLYAHAVSFQRAVFRLTQLQARDGVFFSQTSRSYGYEYWWLIPCLAYNNMTLLQHFYWKACDMDVQHGNLSHKVRENVYQCLWWRSCQMEGWTIWCFSSVGVSVLRFKMISIVKVQCNWACC